MTKRIVYAHALDPAFKSEKNVYREFFFFFTMCNATVYKSMTVPKKMTGGQFNAILNQVKYQLNLGCPRECCTFTMTKNRGQHCQEA